MLLEHGASPLLKNKSGKVPYEIADNPHIKTMLLNAVMSVNAERLMPYSSEKVQLQIFMNDVLFLIIITYFKK